MGKEQSVVSSPDLAVQCEVVKPALLPDFKIAFVQHAYANSADEMLDERLKMLIAHNVNKPHLTLDELSSFAGVTSGLTSRLLKKGLQALWHASPPELQKQYPLDLILRPRQRGPVGAPLSAEHRANISEAKKGKSHSPETRAKIGRGNKGKKVSPETRARISEANKGILRSLESRARMSESKKGKLLPPRTPEHKQHLREAQLRSWERRKQQDIRLIQEQQETVQIFPSSTDL